MLKYNIIIIDDEQIVCRSLKRLLESDEWQVTTVQTISEFEQRITDSNFDLALIDYKLETGTGFDVLEILNERSPDTIPIILTAYGNISLAVEAVKKGAYDFLEKESKPELLRHVISNALEKALLRKEVEALQAQCNRGQADVHILAESPEMKDVLRIASDYAQYDATVLIDGETGTGKSILAEYLHQNSPRKGKPFITINCGAIPGELIESELFGYEKGAFTGANKDGKYGLIERADGGTLFLDEIGNLPLSLQTKLLHVLEKGEFIRVGGTASTKVDVRYIAATNADLEQLITRGEFREDLYYRLNIAHITIPPLREHPEDILPLAKIFLQALNTKCDKEITGFSADAESQLLDYTWPGNVRELKNIIERVVLLTRNSTIEKSDLFILEGKNGQPTGDSNEFVLNLPLNSGSDVLELAQVKIIEHAWDQSGHNQTQAAKILGIPRTTLQHHLQKLNLI